ncbi:MAG: type II toxin-antitoxin system RelB/DinJ family antitoxin [Defluviitaleaceae bacterium]|nr:type II toxin-antitoxin system RelB/DinJ family antitoxin [Defluviitaleaceae bacterium]
MSVQVSTRVDTLTKERFDEVCGNIGISPSNALSIFIKGVINHNGIPFNVIMPTETPTKLSREDAFGCMRGRFVMAEDFNLPLDDFKEYME